MKAVKINWPKLWEKFDKWYNEGEGACAECGLVDHSNTEWEAQKRKIQQLVSARLRGKK